MNLEPINDSTSAEGEGLTFPAYRPFLRMHGSDKSTAIGSFARVDGKLVGLALGAMPKPGNPAPPTLLSLYVMDAARHHGVGAALCRDLENQAAVHESGLLRANYTTGSPLIEYFERVLKSGGWEDPIPRMLALKCDQRTLRENAPWLIRRRPLQAGYRIIPWGEVTEAQRTEIRESDAAEPWIAPDLVPFNHEKDYDTLTSLALEKDGKIVGWVINHRLDETVRYTCSFVHPKLQRFGYVFTLYQATSDLLEKHGLRYLMWTVPYHHEGMKNFALRAMAPYAISCKETRGAEKRFPHAKV